MGQYSYQDLDTQLKQLKDRVDFIMAISSVTVQVNNPLSLEDKRVVQIPMETFYREVKGAGGRLIDVPVETENRIVEAGVGAGDSQQAPGDAEPDSANTGSADSPRPDSGTESVR